MKNFFKFFRNLNRVRGAKVPLLIISMALVIGFTMAGCSDEPENTNQTPVAGDFDISGTGTFTFDGAAKTVTVTPKAGKTSGAVTVKYNGTAAAPSAVGTYTVTFDVAAATGWNAASGLSAGTLTINAASSFTVTFNSNGGSAVNSITGIASGTTITKPTDPTKANSTFGGWYKEAALTNAWNFATDTVNAAVTLYAKWNSAATNFTVTFNANNGTANTTETVAQGGKATKPTDPIKTFALAAGLYAGPLPTSFTFIEWRKSDGTAWNFTTDSVTSNITLTAAYTSSPINIEYQTGANIIAKAVNAIDSSATEYTLVLDANVDNVAAITLSRNNVTLTITSVDTTERVISKGTASGAIFTIGAVAGTSTNVKLVIDGNVTLQGKSDNSAALVRINTGGSLELKGNAKITGNANTSSGGNGSGINASGTITMSDNAQISGNTTMTGSGAGVYLSGTSASPASLTMDGNAKITNNSSSQPDSNTFSDVSSGGVFIGSNATFTMNGGEISGNSAATSTGNSSGQARGGGVFINGSSSAQFIVASDAVKANIKDNTVTAAGGTAGAQVYKNAQGVFTVGGTAQANGINQGWDSWD